MNSSRIGAHVRHGHRPVEGRISYSVVIRQALRTVTQPRIWLVGALFFVAATPFELSQSGAAYLVRVCAAGAIVGYAVIVRRARIRSLSPIVLAVVASFMVSNLFAWTDRAFIAIVTIVVGTLLGQLRETSWNREFRDILIVYLSVHCGGLLVANALFYGWGQVVDLHHLIFPTASRAEGYGAIGRLSGFHTEPGTYSQWTLMALYLVGLMRGRLYSFWSAMVALSVVLTISLWGFVAFGVFAVAFAIEALMSPGKGRRIRAALSLLLFVGTVAVIALSISSYIVEDAAQFLGQKAEMKTASGLDKIHATEFMRQVFGDVIVLGRPLDPALFSVHITPRCRSWDERHILFRLFDFCYAHCRDCGEGMHKVEYHFWCAAFADLGMESPNL